MPKKLTATDFIERANRVHNNYYNYSLVVYNNMHTKVKIIDPIFGEFWQTPMGHLQGQGHPLGGKVKSANKRRKTKEEFIKEAIKKHGDFYEYSKVEYTHCDIKVCIIDPEYGEFWQSPYQHLNSHGCPERTKNKRFIEHIDHIIPLSIIRSSKRPGINWDKDRPLYKFLNSDINLKKIKAQVNRKKSDLININGKLVSAHSVRNNYKIISQLIKNLLKVDPTKVISDDQKFIENYFNL